MLTSKTLTFQKKNTRFNGRAYLGLEMRYQYFRSLTLTKTDEIEQLVGGVEWKNERENEEKKANYLNSWSPFALKL